MGSMIAIAIDVGVCNFAMCVATITLEETRVTHIYKYNLLNCSARRGGMAEIDGLREILDKHRLDFLRCDIVLVERQPPQGLLSIQSVLYDRFVGKVRLVMPQSMHRYYGLHGKSYDERKVSVEAIARTWLQGDCLKAYDKLARKHDVGDAVCFLVMYADAWRKKQTKNPFARFAKTSSSCCTAHRSQTSS